MELAVAAPPAAAGLGGSAGRQDPDGLIGGPSTADRAQVEPLRDEIALDEFSAVEIRLHGLAGRAVRGIGIHREPFAVDRLALRPVFQPHLDLDDIVGVAPPASRSRADG